MQVCIELSFEISELKSIGSMPMQELQFWRSDSTRNGEGNPSINGPNACGLARTLGAGSGRFLAESPWHFIELFQRYRYTVAIDVSELQILYITFGVSSGVIEINELPRSTDLVRAVSGVA